MNLGDMGRDALPFAEAEARRLTMHEFGHALGMLHEHQSPTGGCGPEYYEDALMAYGAMLGWSREKALSKFIPYSASAELNATEVDRKSIMHYSLPPWLFKGGEKSPCVVKPNFELSEGDKAFISKVYSKSTDPHVVATGPSTSTTRASVAASRAKLVEEYKRALREAGIESKRIESLSTEFRASLATK